jgi:threonine dehydratase
VDEGLVAKTMLDVYENESLIVEPAGALSVAGLELRKEQIVGKNIVCVISGSNNDISRLPEIRLRSKIYQSREGYYVLSSA